MKINMKLNIMENVSVKMDMQWHLIIIALNQNVLYPYLKLTVNQMNFIGMLSLKDVVVT